MALKTLQKKYDELLKVFEELGVKLNESQKDTLDTFMLDFQAKLNETRDNAVRVTKRLVEEKLEKEFKEVFESIRTHQKEVFEKSSRIDNLKHQSILVEAIDQYLDEYVKEVLPKKSIVDYSRMQRLEQVQESLKGLLLVNDGDVEKKVAEAKAEIESKTVAESNELKEKVASYEKQLTESDSKFDELSKKYENLRRESLIAEKTKNLPIVESDKMRERLSKLTSDEIEKNYKTILESIQEEMAAVQDKTQQEKNLEEAITELLEGDDSKKTGSEETTGTENNAGSEDEKAATQPTSDDEEGGVQVTESMMQSWIETLARITPKH